MEQTFDFELDVNTEDVLFEVENNPDDVEVDVSPTEQLNEVDGGAVLVIDNHKDLKGRDLPNQHPISAITGLETALNGKQAVIPDLEEIRQGAEKGETAVQPDILNNYATTKALTDGLATKQPIGDYATKQELNAKQDKGDYALKSEIPTQTSQLKNNSDFTTKAYVDGLVGDIETLLNNINSGG